MILPEGAFTNLSIYYTKLSAFPLAALTGGIVLRMNLKLKFHAMKTNSSIKLFTAFLLVLALQCLVKNAVAQQPADTTGDDGTIKPLVKIQKELYSEVRKQFRTTLIKQGASPRKTKAADSADVAPAGVTQVFFKSGDLVLKAWMNVPHGRAEKKYPVVVFLHGGFSFGKEDWDMTLPFRDAGFIVIAPMLRGENNQPGIFSLFYDEVDDVLAAAVYARQQPFIDKAQIYLAGHSTGGTITLLAAMSTNYFRKAASFSASPDQLIYCRYGIPAKIIPFDTLPVKEFEVRSPLAYAGSFKCPVRMYYGTNEPHFHLSTLQTAAVAKKQGLDVASEQIAGGHEDAVPQEMKRAIKFFKQK
jgi:dienelactone hydrolase